MDSKRQVGFAMIGVGTFAFLFGWIAGGQYLSPWIAAGVALLGVWMVVTSRRGA